MGRLRSNKTLTDYAKKKRVRNTRTSGNVFDFHPTDILIYETLPTNLSILNFYKHKISLKQKRSSIVFNLSTELFDIWFDFKTDNNIKISLLNIKTINVRINKLIDEYQKLQKDIKRKNIDRENKFIEKMELIFPCVLEHEKALFENNFEMENLPKSKYNWKLM